MSEDTEKYIEGLSFIRQAMKIHRKNYWPVAILLAIGGVGAVFIPPLVIVSWLAVFLYLYSHIKTVMLLCPRCKEPFISIWVLPIGLNRDNCQSCNLSMDLLEKYNGISPKPHDEEWHE